MRTPSFIASVTAALFLASLSPAFAGVGSTITSPDGGVISGLIELQATYDGDATYDRVGFGVKTTCEPREGVVVNGTVDTGGAVNVLNGAAYVLSSPTWDGATFTATIDASTWDLGTYCFAFNPGPSGGDRVTQEFVLADARVEGGGQILHDGNKISFGGSVFRVGPGSEAAGVGSWSTTFHDVSVDAIDSTTFEGDVVTGMTYFEDGSIANFDVAGTLDGAAGYRMIVRVEDAGEPGRHDTIRLELFGPSGKVYDSYSSHDSYPGDSTRSGTARTYLDRGNLQVETR